MQKSSVSSASSLVSPPARLFAEMLEAPAMKDVDPLGFQFNLRLPTSATAMCSAGHVRSTTLRNGTFGARFLVLPRTKIGILRLGAEYGLYAFGIPDGAQVPDRLQSLVAIVGLDTKFSDSLLFGWKPSPAYYFADDLDGQDFNVPFIIGGTYLYSSTLQFVFGIAVDLEGQYPVLPGGGVRWKFAPKWVLNATLPTPRLEYEANRNLTIYAGGEVRRKTSVLGRVRRGPERARKSEQRHPQLHRDSHRRAVSPGRSASLQAGVEGGYVPLSPIRLPPRRHPLQIGGRRALRCDLTERAVLAQQRRALGKRSARTHAAIRVVGRDRATRSHFTASRIASSSGIAS